jgi:DNA repair exonuclease SbcCD nuclease subunit
MGGIMQKISFVHIADLHLGQPVKGWKWSREDMWIRQEEYLRTFQRIITFVEESSVPFLLIAGDFLEHGFVTTSLYQYVLTQLERIPQTRVFISPGNHDPIRVDSVYHHGEWPENVYIFSDRWESLYFPEYDLSISGKGFPDFSDRENTLPYPNHDAAYRIYVVHGDFKEDQSIYFPILEDQLMEHEVDYVALGHIHKRQTYCLKNNKGTVVHYPGSPEARSWKETGERFITYGKMDEKGVYLEAIPIQTRRYEQVEVDISESFTLQHIEQCVQAAMNEIAEEDYITIQLMGRSSLSIDDRNWLRKLESRLSSIYKWITIEDRTIPDYDLKQLRNQQNLIGTFVKLMELRIAQETDKKKKRMLQTALYKGIDAMEREAIIQ